MKIYAIFPNPKNGLMEEQLIETENYTQEELRYIVFFDIYLNNWEREIDADTLDEYKIKMSAYINDYAEKYEGIISEDDLEEIADAVIQELTEITESIWEEKEWEDE